MNGDFPAFQTAAGNEVLSHGLWVEGVGNNAEPQHWSTSLNFALHRRAPNESGLKSEPVLEKDFFVNGKRKSKKGFQQIATDFPPF